MNERWRIEQLSDLVSQALKMAPYDGPPSGRVREVPDVRTIRYYTTIGLLDRPIEMRGRTAYYARRHLMQLVAIKRLQTKGASLVQIQEALVGASDKKLAQFADLPAGFFDAAPASADSARNADFAVDAQTEDAGVGNRQSRRQFWAEIPGVTSQSTPGDLPNNLPRKIAVLPVGPKVSLLFEGTAAERLTQEYVASLQPALATLYDAIIEMGLTQSERDVDAGDFDPIHKDEEKPQ